MVVATLVGSPSHAGPLSFLEDTVARVKSFRPFVSEEGEAAAKAMATNAPRVRSRAAIEAYEIDLAGRYPKIANAGTVRETLRDFAVVYQTMDIPTRKMFDEASRLETFGESAKLLMKYLTKSSDAGLSASQLLLYRAVFKGITPALLDNPDDPKNFVMLYALARKIQDESGEFVGFAEELMKRRIAQDAEVTQAVIDLKLVLRSTYEFDNFGKTVSEARRNWYKLRISERREALERLARAVTPNVKDLDKAMPKGESALKLLGFGEADMASNKASFVRMLREAVEGDSPAMDQWILKMFNRVRLMNDDWKEGVRMLVRRHPDLSDSPDFKALLEEPEFRAFAERYLMH